MAIGAGAMDIRTATSDDASQVADLVNRLIVELGGRALAVGRASAAFREIASDPSGGCVLVAEDQDRLVGLCTMSFQAAVRTLGTYAIIQETYVDPDYRGRTVGAQLIERALAEARGHGCGVVELGTPPNGQRQEAFYTRMGFKPVGLRFRAVLAQGGE